MTDPFQDVDAAGPEFIKIFADAMDLRQSDPAMEQIVADYLHALPKVPDGLTVEIGAGAGAISRRIAAHARTEQVIGFEPSAGFVAEARLRSTGVANLTFETADGTAIPLADGTVDYVIMHTVLTHVPEPIALIKEAARLLKPGGQLVICDADFSKATLSSYAHDPLNVCADLFVAHFVTDPHIVGKLPQMVTDAGLAQTDLQFATRVVRAGDGMLPWVRMTTQMLRDRGDIGPELADGLLAEYARRASAGALYGYQVFATLIAQRH